MKTTLTGIVFMLGFIVGVAIEHSYFLRLYTPAPNFPYYKPTPAYVLKRLPENLKDYRVVLEPDVYNTIK